MIRILGLDYGDKTVGVAVSDPLGITAQSVETIFRKRETKLRRTCARIEELIAGYEVQKIVLGFPVNMDGTYGERCEKTLAFRDLLQRRTGLEVVLEDERLTTVSAQRVLMESGVRREHRKEKIDTVAAVFILQTYLDRLNREQSVQEGQ